MTVKLSFDETVEALMGRHSTHLSGTYDWIDWDAIYADLLEEGFEGAEASVLLDEFMEKKGF
jgi:hypothetical protein